MKNAKKVAAIAAIASVALLSSVALAHHGEENAEARKVFKGQLRTQREAIKADLKAAQDKFKAEREALRSDEMKARRDELKAKQDELKEEFKKEEGELKAAFRQNFESVKNRARIAHAHRKAMKILLRFRHAAARFDHIAKRLESRLAKMKERGIDVASVTVMLEKAKNAKVDVDLKIEKLKEEFQSLLDSQKDPKEVLARAKEVAKELKADIKALKQKFHDILMAIKDLLKSAPDKDDEDDDDDNDNATTTATSTQ